MLSNLPMKESCSHSSLQFLSNSLFVWLPLYLEVISPYSLQISLCYNRKVFAIISQKLCYNREVFATMKCLKRSPLWPKLFSWTPQLKQEASIGRRLAFTICLFILTLQFGYLCYFGEVWILYFTNWKLILCLLWLYNSPLQSATNRLLVHQGKV